jgi:hypothetical protein
MPSCISSMAVSCDSVSVIIYVCIERRAHSTNMGRAYLSCNAPMPQNEAARLAR